jgi:SAM-dependent methyltransferase
MACRIFKLGARMFCINHLNALRASEIEDILTRFPPGARILELGAGTGRQALEISRRGFEVEAIEIGSSNYAEVRLFPIVDYDGRNIPFPDNSFDVVFSSNVLEHVPDLAKMHAEILRVLRPGGKCVHVLPTDSWRFWTTLSAFPAALQYALTLRDQFRINWPVNGAEFQRLKSVGLGVARHLSAPFRQTRHGERGNIITEVWYFRPSWWRANFQQNGFRIFTDAPMGVFYTGNMVRHTKWSIQFRRKAARWFGSACHIFELVPEVTKPSAAAISVNTDDHRQASARAVG